MNGIWVTLTLSFSATVAIAAPSTQTMPVGRTTFSTSGSTALKILKEETYKEAKKTPSLDEIAGPQVGEIAGPQAIEMDVKPIKQIRAQVSPPSPTDGFGEATEIIHGRRR